jgi:hypothetical protein
MPCRSDDDQTRSSRTRTKTITGPKNPWSGTCRRGQPDASHPANGRVFPTQLISTLWNSSAKKMTIAAMAMAAENAVVVTL